MNRIAFWGVTVALCLGAAYGGYQYGLWKIPYTAMSKAEAGIAKRAGGYNTMLHPPRPSHKSRTIVRPSPDQLYSACVYDLTDGPLLLAGDVPTGSYWSMSFFQHNTDVFFVENDRQIETPQFRYILAQEGQEIPSGTQGRVLRSPSKTGIIIQRVFIDRDERADELDAQRKTAQCAPLEG